MRTCATCEHCRAGWSCGRPYISNSVVHGVKFYRYNRQCDDERGWLLWLASFFTSCGPFGYHHSEK